MSDVVVTNAVKKYDAIVALGGVSIHFKEGELFGLLGPSGSGKTTLLRAIAGFVTLDEGSVLIDGQDISGVPVHLRNIGMMFQNYALFPHLSVADNVAFGLEVRSLPKAEVQERVRAALGMVRLTGLEQRRPKQLSGGQQQRVALARALVTRPKVLLLDEPLGALDKHLRQEMQIELRRIQRAVGITTIFVTHDQEEALTLSDRIAIFDSGRIVQEGAPMEVYERPRSKFAAGFLGEAN
jgi:ABC-type Fe3+/spermidine/putrescine transport system ATPase subunit